jgi:ABC-2 type transport system permease protein
MTNILLIARRELGAFFRSWTGYIIIAAVLFVEGLFFHGFALGGADKRSGEVLSNFFFFMSGGVMIASPLIAMRLLAEERQTGTINLLYSSPVRDVEIVVGKYLSALVFLSVMTLLTLHMPLLIFIHGKVSWAHILTGYFGLLLLGSASVAICTFGSALSKSQVMAAIVSACLMVAMVTCWWVGRVTERPLSEIFTQLALWGVHFPPFQAGVAHLRDVAYFLAITYVFLFGAVRVIEARRWR